MASNGAATRGEGKRLRSRDMVDCLQWKPGSYYVVVGSSRPSQSHEHRIESCQVVVQHILKSACFLIECFVICKIQMTTLNFNYLRCYYTIPLYRHCDVISCWLVYSKDSNSADLVVIRRKRKANDIVADSNGSGHRVVEDESRAKATPEPRPASNPSHAIVNNDNHASHYEQPESALSNDTPHHDQECESHDGPENDIIVCVTPPEIWTDAQLRYPLVNRLEDVQLHSPGPHCVGRRIM